jgi:hypothetical protein
MPLLSAGFLYYDGFKYITVNTLSVGVGGDITGSTTSATVLSAQNGAISFAGGTTPTILSATSATSLTVGTNFPGAFLILNGGTGPDGYVQVTSGTTIFGSNSNNKVFNSSARITTSSTTPTVFPTTQYTMPDLTTADVIVTVVAKVIGTSDSFVQDYRARYYRSGSPTTLIGSVINGTSPVGTGVLSTASATLILNFNTVEVQVTGVASTNIAWSCIMQVQEVQ